MLVRSYQHDWVVGRHTSRAYYPPRSQKLGKVALDGSANPWHPGRITIPGPQCFHFCKGIIPDRRIRDNQIRAWKITLGVSHPFTSAALLFAKQYHAAWNQMFNTWEIPLKAQTPGGRFKEALLLMETVAMFVPCWGNLEVVFPDLPPRASEELEKRILNANSGWRIETDLLLDPCGVAPGLTEDQVTEEVQKFLSEKHGFEFPLEAIHPWHLLNHIRHKYTSYEAQIRGGQYTSRDHLHDSINREIQKMYPWALGG